MGRPLNSNSALTPAQDSINNALVATTVNNNIYIVCKVEFNQVTILRSGSNQNYSDNWERAFGGKKKKKKNNSKPSTKKISPKKKSATAKKKK